MCVRVAVELRLFQIIEERAPASVTAAELARASSADRSFIGLPAHESDYCKSS